MTSALALLARATWLRPGLVAPLRGLLAALVAGLLTGGCQGAPVVAASASTGEQSLSVKPPGCTADAQCDDGIHCNGLELCAVGKCNKGTAPTCGDALACTYDVCDEEVRSCRHLPDHATCAAGELCTPTGGCAAAPPCATDADCDDAIACNGVEQCVSGACQGSEPPQCDDGVACTIDFCSETTGCVHVADDLDCGWGARCALEAGCATLPTCTAATDCDDNVHCNGGETCQAGQCYIGARPAVSDGVTCTVDLCEEATRSTLHLADTSLCPVGSQCRGAAGCIAEGTTPAGCTGASDCADNVWCNGDEVCTAGVCLAGPRRDCEDGDAGTADVCEESSASCFHFVNDVLQLVVTPANPTIAGGTRLQLTATLRFADGLEVDVVGQAAWSLQDFSGTTVSFVPGSPGLLDAGDTEGVVLVTAEFGSFRSSTVVTVSGDSFNAVAVQFYQTGLDADEGCRDLTPDLPLDGAFDPTSTPPLSPAWGPTGRHPAGGHRLRLRALGKTSLAPQRWTDVTDQVTWHTPNPFVVPSIDASGVLTTGLAGAAFVTAELPSGVVSFLTGGGGGLTVDPAGDLDNIRLSGPRSSDPELLAVGVEHQLGIVGTFSEAAAAMPAYCVTLDASWSSMNTQVATISASGLLAGRSVGTDVVAALVKGADGLRLSDTIAVSVGPAEVVSVAINPAVVTMTGDGFAQLSVEITFTDGSVRVGGWDAEPGFTWSILTNADGVEATTITATGEVSTTRAAGAIDVARGCFTSSFVTLDGETEERATCSTAQIFII